MTEADGKTQAGSASTSTWYCPTCDLELTEERETCPNDGARLVRLRQKADRMIGRVLDDRFTITEKLGGGGMGAVYKALQHSVDRDVAVKVIHSRFVGDRTAAKRFFREARLASKLAHKNTVTVLDFGQTEDELLFLVMELLVGDTLSEVIKSEAPLGIERSVEIALQVCDALEAAHDLDIVHRDLKPSNIMLVGKARRDVKVLDFGLAKTVAGDETTVTQSDVMVGTPKYMSPDSMLGHTIDARSDLYSLGVIFYQMLSGELPFRAQTVNTMLAQHAMDPPAELGSEIPVGLRRIIERLLAKHPAQRYSSATKLREALVAGQADGFASEPARTALDDLELGETITDTSSKAGVALQAAARAETQTPTETTGNRSRWVALLALLVLLGGAGVAGVVLTRGDGSGTSGGAGESSGAAAPVDRVSDAGAVAAADAGVGTAKVEAVVDAGTAAAAPVGAASRGDEASVSKRVRTSKRAGKGKRARKGKRKRVRKAARPRTDPGKVKKPPPKKTSPDEEFIIPGKN